MEQKLKKAADEWFAGYASGTHVGEMAKPYLLAAFKAGAEWLKKIQAENRAKLFTDFNPPYDDAPSFVPFPKSQLKELQEYEWQKYRMKAAKEIMTATENSTAPFDNDVAQAKYAVRKADALIAELKKREE